MSKHCTLHCLWLLRWCKIQSLLLLFRAQLQGKGGEKFKLQFLEKKNPQIHSIFIRCDLKNKNPSPHNQALKSICVSLKSFNLYSVCSNIYPGPSYLYSVKSCLNSVTSDICVQFHLICIQSHRTHDHILYVFSLIQFYSVFFFCIQSQMLHQWHS